MYLNQTADSCTVRKLHEKWCKLFENEEVKVYLRF